MSALLLEPIDELVAIGVQPIWLTLPVEWREGLAYWALAQGVMLQDDVRPVGPPRNIEWTFASEPQHALGIRLRHPCPACQATIDETAAKLAQPNNRLVVGIAQFTVDYLRTPQEMISDEPSRRVYRVYREGN